MPARVFAQDSAHPSCQNDQNPYVWAMIRKNFFLARLLVAIFAVHAATNAAAQDVAPQSWVPSDLAMPDDAELQSDRAIGSSLRMFSFTTEEDVDDLLTTWEEDLRLAGYNVLIAQDPTLERIIEFSGNGINNAKIAVAPASSDARRLVEFDATLQ